MIRTPLRPLASVISARDKGVNPDFVEKENLRRRHEDMRDQERQQAETRLLALGVMFALAFIVVGARMATLASSAPHEPRAESLSAASVTQRADIIDRNGAILATNLITNALYAQPPMMIDKAEAARKLAQVFPDMDAAGLEAKFASDRKFVWLRRKMSPEQVQRVHDIGEPGLLFGSREMRLYPNGRLAAHVLGGASFGREGVRSAEVVGIAGIEHEFDTLLGDPARKGEPLRLTIDLSVQAATRRVLEGGMKMFSAKGAAAVLLDVQDGEILALVSLPDFDPNARPRPLRGGKASESPLFNRAAQGLYELGSTFKVFVAAQSLETGIAGPDTMVDTQGPIRKAGFTIRDFHDYGRKLSLTDVVVHSSNIGAANLATEIGPARQQRFLDALGLLVPLGVELPEARNVRPLVPKHWTDLSAMTIAYGHGIAVTPLHLATAYASLVNGGHKITPTLRKPVAPPETGPRLVSEDTSKALRLMLRQVVTRGTASLAEVPGYEVGGKTGSADKPKPGGGYEKEKLVSTFAAIFPSSDPKYVLVVTYDEPVETSGLKPRRTAGWTAAPVAAEIITRVAPLLDMHPAIAPGGRMDYMLSSY
ncbi:MAG: peptidoglycan D,D-transpeptidase FtsI family protein [Paracoccaceae bacterium]